VQISPADAEIIWLKLKKEIMEGKIYSPVDKFAEQAKNNKWNLRNPEQRPKYIKITSKTVQL